MRGMRQVASERLIQPPALYLSFSLKVKAGASPIASGVTWSGPLGAEKNQAADLTIGRGLRSSNCCGLR
jgi:hypothetical protein